MKKGALFQKSARLWNIENNECTTKMTPSYFTKAPVQQELKFFKCSILNLGLLIYNVHQGQKMQYTHHNVLRILV